MTGGEGPSAPDVPAPGHMSRKIYSKARQSEHKDLAELLSSLDRSRKRNLSEGLLRGDQAQDRLRTQEASASPLLKKQRDDTGSTPEKNEMALSMANFKAYMDANTNKTLKNLQTSISVIDDTVKGNSARLDRQEATIKQNQAGIREMREEITCLKEPKRNPTPTPWGQQQPETPGTSISTEQKREFDVARRSLRLWPIQGTVSEEIWRSVGDFLERNLDQPSVTEDMIESIVMAQTPSGPGVTREALVVFKQVSVRDQVLGAAARLAPFKDGEG